MLTVQHTEGSWRDRVRGCLLGGALGDAVGRPFEGQPAVQVRDVEAVVANAELTWTDDTALLLALADHLATVDDATALDDDGLAHTFARAWQAEPHRGYGANRRASSPPSCPAATGGRSPEPPSQGQARSATAERCAPPRSVHCRPPQR